LKGPGGKQKGAETLDLKELSGLAMIMDSQGSLSFDPDVCIDEAKTRILDELTDVYLDKTACRGNEAAYWMFNGVYTRSDQARLGQALIRYELTLFPDKCIGREFVKTHGHIHKPEPRSGIDYPEICEVLVGTAHFLFQTLDPEAPSSSEAFYTEVKAGEKIVVPPGYDHLTINPGPGPMLFSDVVSLQCGGNYARIKQAGGAAYLEIAQAGQALFIPNPRYISLPVLRKAVPREFPELNLVKAKPLYTAFLENAGLNWQFLWNPELFKGIFSDLNTLFNFS
jgi:glucose-6-phosphate isomerase, archaeal